MIRTRVMVSALAVIALAACACSIIIDSPHTHTGCEVWYDGNWPGLVGGELNHSDARSCPVGVAVGEETSSSADVWDTRASYPDRDAWIVYMEVGDDITPSHYCSGILDSDTEFFAWIYNSQESRYESHSELSVTFTRGVAPDYVCFRVGLLNDYPVLDTRAAITMYYVAGPQGIRSKPGVPHRAR